ncbi:unnamed protein product [Chilo suppressalis]|uniref:FHA domain-containing protein n=1 Tax=Chilo suppressalis TaxID=168631 RepID=A0ABN8B5B0_CHISP|nr:unnamed protein product [Chilo suppressalis]
MDDSKSEETPKQEPVIEFKKPVLFGRIGKLPKKVTHDHEKAAEDKKVPEPTETKSEEPNNSSSTTVTQKESVTPIPYKEPKWSGICPDGANYGLEVLKSGMIVENIDLTKKSFYVFGRLANCDVVMAHPTISRYHCILQYKAFAEEGEPPCGWYLHDMGSTHGTFLNKERLKSNHYTRVRVGHQIKFGSSSRTYIMLGPDFDCEGESELSVTEIKQRALNMKLDRQRLIAEDIERRERERIEEERKREEQGIDWGLGEDAEEEPDLAENPYASTANEELYLEDPKKTLRGYYEREGHDLNYDCEERGVGQFLCRVELPIDDARGNPVKAEVIHRGKKKEAVIACALEACRILDRAGLLRQAKHESRRRKQRDWSADDYYDSDEDTFLDRTGSVEKKRTLRMMRHGASEDTGDKAKPLTYDDLLKQITEIESKISSEERCLERLRTSRDTDAYTDADTDALDAFMTSLGKQGQSMAQKAEISKTKMSIQKLKSELSKTQRLAELARPAHLPPLVKQTEPKMAVKVANNSVVYGKRIRLKEDGMKKPKVAKEIKKVEEEFVEEVDSDEETIENKIVTEKEIKSNNRHQEKTKETSTEKDGDTTTQESDKNSSQKRVFGPMRPPENYVIPENYFDQETDRDLPEIVEDE